MASRGLTALVLLGFLAAGCADNPDERSGRVSFFVSDAPTDEFSSINITFSRGAIHRSGDNDSDPNSTVGWTNVVNSTTTVDLLAHHNNGTAAALGYADVPAGRYQQIRLYIDSVVGTRMGDGSDVPMTVPSGVVRTVRSFDVAAGGNTTLNLEISLDQSIKCNNQGCTFSPKLGRVQVEATD